MSNRASSTPATGRVPSYIELPVPLSVNDLHFGHFDQACLAIAQVYPFSGRSIDEMRELLAACFGYDSYQQARAACASVQSEMVLPENVVVLSMHCAWRGYLRGTAALPDLIHALGIAFMNSELSAVDRVDTQKWSSRPYDRDRVEEDFRLRANAAAAIGAVKSPWLTALRTDGMIWFRERADGAIDTAIRYWEENCGKSAVEVRTHIVDNLWYPLLEAIRSPIYYSEVSPPGLRPVTLHDAQCEVLGHAFESADVSGYMQYVYPPEGDEFVRAWADLWNRRPPAPTSLAISGTFFVGDYDSPWHQGRLVRTEPPRDPFAGVRMGPEPVPLRVVNGRIDCGVAIEIEGEHYTRPIRNASTESLEGKLGLVLKPDDPDPDEWLRMRAPIAIELGAAVTASRLASTLDDLAEAEEAWFSDEKNRTDLELLAHLTSPNAIPGEAVSTMHLRANNPMVEFDIHEAGPDVRRAYPCLASLPDAVLGEYALDFWTKNGIRHDRMQRSWDPKFVAHAIMRNLGLDPNSSGYYRRMWMGVMRLVRAQIAVAVEEGKFSETLPLLRKNARELFLRAKETLDLYDVVESEAAKMRFSARPPRDGLVDYQTDYMTG